MSHTVPIYRAHLPGQQPSASVSPNTPEQSGTAREAPSQSRDTVRCSPREGEGASALSPPIPIVVPPPQTIAAVVASTSRDAPAASPFEMPDIPKFLERRIA